MIIFRIKEDFIPLIQLLKATRIAQSGGDAQRLVEDGLVFLNGKQESRKRAKIRNEDIVKCFDKEVKVLKSDID